MSPAFLSSATTSVNDTVQLHTAGLIIELTIKSGGKIMDVSSAISKKIIIKPPSGEKIEKVAEFAIDGTDGKILCITVDDDLSVVGDYQVQGYIELPDFSGFSSITNFIVADNL